DFLSNPSFTLTGQNAVLEQFVDGTNPFNLDGGFILFNPNSSGGYNVRSIPAPTTPVPALQGAIKKSAPMTPTAKNSARSIAASNSSAPSSTVTVQGTAYDSLGKPLIGVKVVVSCSMALSYQGATSTDQNGHYAISGVPFGGIGVVAMSGNSKLAVGGLVVQSGTTATIDLRPLSNQKSAPIASLNFSFSDRTLARAGWDF